MTEGFEWTVDDVYNAQTMCPYETVAYGFSMFCNLFTYEEWQGFGYSIDLWFSGGNAFQSPVGVCVQSAQPSNTIKVPETLTLSSTMRRGQPALGTSRKSLPG